MATWGNQIKETMLAGADLSSSQFTFVKMNTTNRTVVAAGNGEAAFGVLQNDPASGEAAAVCVHGRTLIEVGETLTAGDSVGIDANGKAVTATSSDVIVGICIDGAATGARATIDFFRGGNANA